jgi:hypothetical protein
MLCFPVIDTGSAIWRCTQSCRNDTIDPREPAPRSAGSIRYGRTGNDQRFISISSPFTKDFPGTTGSHSGLQEAGELVAVLDETTFTRIQ